MTKSTVAPIFARALLLGAVSLPTLAFAQVNHIQPSQTEVEASLERTDTLAEVIVTARRRAENVQNIPVAVTAYGSESLEKLVVENAQDLSKLSPGLQSTGTASSRSSFSPSIRGQGTSFGTSQASVIPYFAEAPNFDVSFFDLESLQIIKGAQGTLFGETATGGVILFQPQKPTNEFEGYLRAGLGNYNYKEFEGAVGGALIDDVLMVRIAGQVRQRDGFTTAYISQPGLPARDWDDVDRMELRGSVIFRPFQNLEIYTVIAKNTIATNGQSSPIYAIEDRAAAARLTPAQTIGGAGWNSWFRYAAGYDAPAGQTWMQLLQNRLALQQTLGPRAQTSSYDHYRETEFTGVVNHVTWDISDNLTLKNIYSIGWTNSYGATIEADGSNLPLIDTREQVCLPGVSPEHCVQAGARSWTNETQLQGVFFDNRLNFQTGFYYRKTPARDWASGNGTITIFGKPQGLPSASATCISLGVAAGTPCNTITKSMSESYATFAQATFVLTDKINITAGGRRTWDYRQTITAAGPVYFREYGGENIPISVLGVDPIPGTTTSALEVPKTSADTYTLAVDWRPTDDILVYATNRTGYKGGGINSSISSGPQRTFGPERVTDYEAGFKADWRPGNTLLRTNVAVFKTDYEDIQRTNQIIGSALTYTENLANATIQGVELEVLARFSDHFQVSAFYSYLDGEFTNWTENATCSAHSFRSICSGLPGTAPIVLDHVAGTATTSAGTQNFRPDAVALLSKDRWSIRPEVNFGFLGDAFSDVTLSANVYFQSPYVTQDTNYSRVINADVIENPKRTLVDLAFNWRNIRGTAVSAYANVTNLADKTVPIVITDVGNIAGMVNVVYNEPRMFFAGLSYKF